ncbi:L,D-transpeptidase [Peribacillus frigoritolerans]|uniref:L,D-transpeptidase n=1 Tax=Peribacillus frigoritolerans TaxID=450367 RepID=UPI0032B4E786
MNKKGKFLLSLGLALGLWAGNHSVSAANKTAADDYIIINKTYNKLAFYEDKKLVGVYPVATGRTKDLTPEGKFKIAQKLVNRPYYKDGIKGGDPRNPLGNRWLGIAVPGKSPAASWGGEYAIHGNNNPSSIGKYVSSGCIRMHDKDVEAIYPRVLMNTPVYIKSSPKSFAALADDLGYIKSTAAKPVAAKQQYLKGSLIGWSGNTFKAKTSKGTKTFHSSNGWLKKELKKGKSYTYFYTVDKKGQYIITKVNK